jgi:hypothetical protein
MRVRGDGSKVVGVKRARREKIRFSIIISQ